MGYNKIFTKQSNLIVRAAVGLFVCTTGCTKTSNIINASNNSSDKISIDKQSTHQIPNKTNSDIAEHIQYIFDAYRTDMLQAFIMEYIPRIASWNAQEKEAITILLDTFLNSLKSLVKSKVLNLSQCSYQPLRQTLLECEIDLSLRMIKTLLNEFAFCVQSLPSDLSKELKLMIKERVITNTNFKKALLLAVEYAQIDVIDTILSGIVEIYGPEEMLEILQALFSKGLEKSHSLLYRAVWSSNPDSIKMVKYLVDRFLGNLNHSFSNTKPLLSDRRSYFFRQLLDELVEYMHGQYHTALHCAFKNADFEKMQSLIEAGANTNIEDSSGKTILDLAFEKNDPIVVQYLLNLDINLKNSQGVLDKIVNQAIKSSQLLFYSKDKKSNLEQLVATELKERLVVFRIHIKSHTSFKERVFLRTEYERLFVDTFKPFYQIFSCQKNGEESHRICDKIIKWLVLSGDILGSRIELMSNNRSMFPSQNNDDSHDSHHTELTCDSVKTSTSSGTGNPQYWNPHYQKC